MNRKAVVALLQSRAFGIIGYSVLIGLAAMYLYTRFIRPNRYEKLNISCFAYRDINRNGIYDLSDRPYAGLKIGMARPKGGRVSAESNLSGFTNFPMSITSSSALVRAPGTYTITVEPPPEWSVTSGNAVQTVAFRELEDSPSGLAAEQTFVPVGVAPNLTISGEIKVELPAPRKALQLRAVSPRGETIEIPMNSHGRFSFAVTPGKWRLDLSNPEGTVASRTVVVANHPVVLSTIDLKAAPARSRTVEHTADFDHLTPSDSLYEIPNGYAGLNWTNWVATHQKFYDGAGYVNGAVSSEYVAYNSSGHPATVWSKDPFDFAGVHITAAWPNTEKKRVVIKAWRESELVHEDRIKAYTAGPIYFAAEYANITRLEISTEAYWQVVLDDFHFRTD